MSALVIATRSPDKLREIRQLLSDLPDLELLDLVAAGVEPRPEEEEIEAFDSFEENALAKARYFAERTGRPVLADDSGLCVDALSGAPGVRSKRYAGRTDLAGIALDTANNQTLIAALGTRRPEERSAHYRCVVAIVTPEGSEQIFQGRVEGRITTEPRGEAGFGYDPYFFVPELDATFAEVPAATKNRISHRAAAIRAAIPALHALVERAEQG